MEAVIERGREAPGIRLVQDAFNMRSLSLYTSVGFDVKEPLALVSGKPRSGPAQHMEVRRLRAEDLDACEALCREVHGFERTAEFRGRIQAAGPVGRRARRVDRRLPVERPPLPIGSRGRRQVATTTRPRTPPANGADALDRAAELRRALEAMDLAAQPLAGIQVRLPQPPHLHVLSRHRCEACR